MSIVKIIQHSGIYLSLKLELNILIIRWTKPVADDMIQEGYWQLLELALKHNCYYWMLDARGRGPGGNNDYWVLETFLPHARETMGKKISIAYLLSPSHYDTVMPRIPHDELEMHKDSFAIMMFKAEGEAIDWLISKQTKN